MYVLAGLPVERQADAVAEMRRLRPGCVVVGAPSGRSDTCLYPARLVDVLIAGVTGFALRRRTRGPATPVAPGSITLLYVPSPDDERLLRAFDFAVLPVRLAALSAIGENGRALRHERRAVMSTLQDVANTDNKARRMIDEVRQRTMRRAESDAILLPPNNFKAPAPAELVVMFKAVRSGARRIDDRFPELQARRLSKNDLSRLDKNEVRTVLVDRRELAFLQAHDTAFHGPARELDEAATSCERQNMLRRLYRFGGPLPDGFHHDVQQSDGSKLRDVEFDCCEQGKFTVSGSHANVYPNDYVRPGADKK